MGRGTTPEETIRCLEALGEVLLEAGVANNVAFMEFVPRDDTPHDEANIVSWTLC